MKIFFKILLLSIVSFSSFSQAENHTPFRFDMGLLYARPSGFGVGGGFYLEPKYLINDNFAVGMKVELDLLGRAKFTGEGENGASLAYLNSYIATADVLMGQSQFRPTFGLGAGLYRLTSLGINNIDYIPEFARGGKFGISPRVGFDLWHFRLSADYNFILGQRNRITGQPLAYDTNHLTVKVGIFLGGGKKREE